ncbi:MAG: phytanoyl-CoA dioxygenase family protein [Spirochaetaceae bacterium]|nr:phytanoyl-CoA dioxygenase family protein [Spirochaetaceae bacterium]
MEVLTEIIGPKLRLESAYSFVRSKGCPQFEMHGGHRGGRVNFRYHVQGDRIFTGLTVVSFALQEITDEDGGFACIPGSHKSDFRVPDEDRARLYAVDGSTSTPTASCRSVPCRVSCVTPRARPPASWPPSDSPVTHTRHRTPRTTAASA